MNTLIKVCKYIFIGFTLFVAGTAIVGMFTGADPTFALIYGVMGYTGIGVIASWREKK